MLPKKVKIGGLLYNVSTIDGPLLTSDGVAMGEILYRVGTLTLAGKDSTGTAISEELRHEIFWHEVLHGIGYNRNIKVLWEEPDEELITAIARGLHAFMVDNGLKFPEEAAG